MVDDIPVPDKFCKPVNLASFRKKRMWRIIVSYALYGEHGGRAYLVSQGVRKRQIDSDLRRVRELEYFDFAYELLNKYGYKLTIERIR
jgi:hypothetical protein